jgi:hypothetical protein
MDIKVGALWLNPTVLLIVMFYMGILLRLLQRASTAFRSKVNTYPSRWSFVSRNWDVFLLRSAINTVLFSLWLRDPGTLSKGVIYLGVTPGLANWITIPPTLTTAASFGFLVDLALDQIQFILSSSPKFAWLPSVFKGEIPSYDPAVVAVDKLSVERKVGE